MTVSVPENIDYISIKLLCMQLGLEFSTNGIKEKMDIYEYDGKWPNHKRKYIGKGHPEYVLR